MHFGISEGKGGLKHGSRPWLGMDIFWNCPLLSFSAFLCRCDLQSGFTLRKHLHVKGSYSP